MEDPKGTLRAFWLTLGQKKNIFNQFFIKFHVFSFLKFVYGSKHERNSLKGLKRKLDPLKLSERVSKNFKIYNFCQESEAFFY